MEKYIRKIGTHSLVVSILVSVLAMCMVLNPEFTLRAVVLCFGYILVVDGIIHFISYFSIEDDYRFFSYELAQSIIDIIFGFLIVANVQVVEAFLPIILGIWIILDGILKLQIATNIRGVHGASWGVMLTMSAISVLLGLVLVFNPIKTALLATQIIGGILVITQLINIFDDVYILSEVGKAKKAVKSVKKTK